MIALPIVLLISAATTLPQNSSNQDPAQRASDEEFFEVAADSADYPLLTGKQSLETIQVWDGFQVELVASEPLVKDPVSFDWGPDGRLWVVEMADYPYRNPSSQNPGGRIKVLTDLNNDGVFDKSETFADGLSTPNSILPWKNGVLVTACPDVLYLEDTNGDGKADRIEKLFTGFNEGNQQHRVNGLAWGIDNWIYLANGDSGGQVVSQKTGQSIDIRGRDLRVRVDSGELETQAGQTQYGRHRDPWGNWFGCNNPNPIFHFVGDETYLNRNPFLRAPAARRDIRRGDARVYPIGAIVSHCDPKYRPMGAQPIFTSACSTIIYNDSLFGEEFRNVTFTSEPVYNLIHARRLDPSGVTFESTRLRDAGQEFFRSSDPWSRPTSVRVGPDGALYVADMVREVIEHPEWIADELESKIDLWSGSEYGRIYRISPIKSQQDVDAVREEVTTTDFTTLSSSELVRHLDSPSGWQRDLVQRMLIWKEDTSVRSDLVELLKSAKRTETRLQALATLDGLKILELEELVIAFADPNPNIQRHAVRLSESWATAIESDSNINATLRTAFKNLISTPSPMLQLQVAYSLGEFDQPWAAKYLGELAASIEHDHDLESAILSSLDESNCLIVFDSLVKPANNEPEFIGRLLAIVIRFGKSNEMEPIIRGFPRHPSAERILSTALQDIRSSKRSQEDLRKSNSWTHFAALISRARRSVSDPNTSSERLLRAIALLGHEPDFNKEDQSLLRSLITTQYSTDVQLAAANRLAETAPDAFTEATFSNWNSLSPSVHQALIELCFSRLNWTNALLVQIESKAIQPRALTASQKDRLLSHESQEVRDRARAMLTEIDHDRKAVFDSFAETLSLVQTRNTDITNGEKLFTEKCSTCHRLGEIGKDIGPNLSTVRDRSPDNLLRSIIIPNMAVEAKYVQYQIVTIDGRAISGVIADETGNRLKIISAEGTEFELLRTDIDEITSSNLSLMPNGLEEGISKQQMADLIEFLIAKTGEASQDY